MVVYPYSAPQILNDQMFVDYGGVVYESTPQIRQACYQMAEQQVSSYIGTLLIPTIVTGSAYYSPELGKIIPTDYGYVTKLLAVRMLDEEGTVVYTLEEISNSIGMIRNDTYGYLYLENFAKAYGCVYLVSGRPFTIEYVYEAGLSTGTSAMPGISLALVNAAQLILNEIQPTPANETTGDAGVTEFTHLRYSEKRKSWKNTVFGNSAKSAWIAKLLDGSIKKARKSLMVG